MGSNGITCTGVEGLRLAYPNRLTDLVLMFGLHPTHLSVMFNLVLEHVHSNFQHLIFDLDQPWLEEGQIRRYALVTQNAGLPISSCWVSLTGRHAHLQTIAEQTGGLQQSLAHPCVEVSICRVTQWSGCQPVWAHGRKMARCCREWAPRQDPFILCHQQTYLVKGKCSRSQSASREVAQHVVCPR